MVGWHDRLSAYESEQASEDGEGQGSLACLGGPQGQRVRHNRETEQQQQIVSCLEAKVFFCEFKMKNICIKNLAVLISLLRQNV